MRYFTLGELVRSETAVRLGLDNTPTPEIAEHLRELVVQLLDPLREAWAARCRIEGWGSPALIVSSGYRSAELNRAVGGAAASAHCAGYAADTIPANGRLRAYKTFCREFLADRAFDQLISENERPDGTPGWMHIGYRTRDGRQRRELLSMRRGCYLPMTE